MTKRAEGGQRRRCRGSDLRLTQRRDVHQHEVPSLGDDGRHSGVSQDGGQTVPLALQLLRQGGEVAVGPSHQLQVVQ